MIKIFTLLFLLLVINVQAQICNPIDFAFGLDGKAVGITSSSNNFVRSSRNTFIQSDTNIIQVFQDYNASNESSFGVFRFRGNGKIDSTFGTNGKVITSMGTDDSYPSMGAVQSDGKILVCGNAINGNNWDFAVIRYNKDGSLDNSFGNGGKVLTPVGLNDDYARGISIQDDGKIIVVGGSGDNMNVLSWAIVRYRSNGVIDSSFGNNGKVISHLGNFIAYIGTFYYGTYANETAISAMVLQNGKIIVAGDSYRSDGCYDYYGGIYCNPAFAMVRYNANGSVDSTFGIHGKVTDSVKLVYGSKIALQDDGKILVTGSGLNTGFIVERYNENGTPDGSFGTGGIVDNLLAGQYNYAQSSEVCVQDANKIIIGGNVYNGSVNKVILLRIDNTGKLDSSFNVTGTAYVSIGTDQSNDYVTGLAMHGKKILVSGYGYISNFNNFSSTIAIVRLLDSVPLLVPQVSPSGELSICQGETLLLQTNETGIIQWYQNNNKIFGANTPIYSAVNAGTYNVSVSNASGCGISVPIVVTEKAAPPVPSITYVSEPSAIYLVTTAGYAGYKWYLNNVIIPGADSNKYTPLQTGSFTVRLTNANNCSSVSLPYNFVVVSVTDIIIGNTKLQFYPNPANTKINLEIPRQPYDKLFAALYDHNGRLMQKIVINHGHNEIDVSSLPAGVYQLQVYSKKERAIRKVMVMK